MKLEVYKLKRAQAKPSLLTAKVFVDLSFFNFFQDLSKVEVRNLCISVKAIAYFLMT